MATISNDFRFRVSKAVGSPSVQGAAGVETLANHTESVNPHPQYMRKTAVKDEFNPTEHIQKRSQHARNYALRDELMTTKLEYEKYKGTSLSRDANNYLAPHGVKAHVVTAFVLNQILADVGLDGSVAALTYNNLVNSYDTKVTDGKRYTPTWEIFLKLKNSIATWMEHGTPDDFLLKATWKSWIQYMYGETDPRDESQSHPLRPGLRVALYATDFISQSIDVPTVSVTSAMSFDRADKRFMPTVNADMFSNAVFYYVRTSDSSPLSNKEYAFVSGGALVPFSGDTFATGTTYYEKTYQHLKKVMGVCLTCGCGILEKRCYIDDRSYFDWYNGEFWEYYAGDINHPETNPWAQKLMVWEGRIRLAAGQTIKFAGIVDDSVYVKIGSTVLTRPNETSYWVDRSDNTTECSTYEDCPKYSYTAPAAGLYDFTLAIFNRVTHGPKEAGGTGGNPFGPGANNVPFRMSLDGGNTFIPITNEALDNPIFFLPEGSEKALAKAADARDKLNYKTERCPGLLLKMWVAPAVSQAGTIDVSTYGPTTEHDKNIKNVEWSTESFRGDQTPGGVDRTWASLMGPHLTNGCSMMTKCCWQYDQTYYDWYNGLDWPYYAGSSTDSLTYPWARRAAIWFGTIYLRKGETVKFKGYIEDHSWLKIDDTWVIDKQACHELVEPTVFSYTSTYTGYHPFKLIARNSTYVGPKMQSSSVDFFKMAINNDNFVEVSNDSFSMPRFFLPDECDHKFFWNQAMDLRAKRAKAEKLRLHPIVMTSNYNQYTTHATAYHLGDLVKTYSAISVGGNAYNAYQLCVGKKFSGGDWVDDPKWPADQDYCMLAVDVGFRCDDHYIHDDYMYLWTPDDPHACGTPADASAIGSGEGQLYLGRCICLQHGCMCAFSDGAPTKSKSVHQQTLIVPKGAIITFVVGAGATTAGGNIVSCHSNIQYYFDHN